jgi:hypothetical protein
LPNFDTYPMRHAFILFLIAAQMHFQVNGQDSGALRFLVEPGHSFKVRVDGAPAVQVRELTLGRGTHELRIWAPGHLSVDTMVTVIEGQRADLVLKLPVDPEHQRYARELIKYQGMKRRVLLLPAATLAGVAYTISSLSKHNRAVNELNGLQAVYDRSFMPIEIQRLKDEEMTRSRSEADKYSKRVVLGSVATSSLAAASIFFILKSVRAPRPVLNDGARLHFEGAAWLPSPTGGTMVFNLSYPIR